MTAPRVPGTRTTERGPSGTDAGHVVAVEDTRHLTRGQWHEQADRLATALAAHGVRRGDRVAVRLQTRLEWLVVSLALGKLGAVQVALNYSLTPPESEYILRDCEVVAVIADDADLGALQRAWDHLGLRLVAGLGTGPGAGPRIPGVTPWQDLLDGHDRGTWPAGTFAPLIVYSSGTTGAPKGAPLGGWTNPPDKAVLRDYAASVGFDGASSGPGNRTLMAMPMHHGAGPASTRASIGSGGTVVLMRRFDAETALALIERHRITHWPTVPTMLHRVVKLPAEVRARYDVSSLRFVSVGAAPVSPGLKEQVAGLFGEVLHEGYGCTEAGMIAGCTPADHRRRPGTSGRPFRHVDLRIVGPDGTPLPPGETGEIAVRTPTVISGYIGRGRLGPDQLDADGYYRTGDLGHLDEDGYLFISDRRTDLVISGGTNIYPAEIEAVLNRHPDVALAAVIGVPHPEHGEQAIAVVEPAPGARPSAEDVIAFCAGRLAPYKWPRRVEFVDALPVNPMGKVEKRRLREPYWRGRQRQV